MVQEKTNSEPEEIAPPPWIHAAFIQKALHNSGERSSQVVNVTVRLAIASGENYCSTIYRVKAVLDDGSERSVLVKEPPPGQEMAGFVKKAGIFRREGGMMAEVIPQMEALLEEAAPGKFPSFTARCPLHGSDPVEFLVLEDLAPAGFKLADRKRGLGLRHSLRALRNLARFHAASHALLRKRPELAERFDNTWRKPNNNMNEFIEGGVQSAADVCRTWPGFEKYADMLEKFKPSIMKTCIELNDPRPEAFNVIIHGDFWVNNMMFRYEDGEPVDQRIVDLQISHVASPALDLLYLLTTSVSENVSAKYEDLLLREYHYILKETMSLLGMQAPPLEALLAAMDAHGRFAVYGAVCVMPLAQAQSTPDLEASNSGDHSGISFMYGTPQLKQWLQRVLPKYERKGWLSE